ncbi:MAG: Prokaryotic dksA/traR C4-type zinc finger [Pseudomonadota bacterium]|jgi:DnaK suppressor protein
MADDADRAQEHMEHMEALRRQKQAPRSHVQRAIDFCVDCGELIEAKRLFAVPTAIRCIHCQGDHERIERQYS